MKTKILPLLLFLILAYVLPVVPKVHALLNPQVWILALVSIVIFITQPPIKIHDLNKNKSTDKYSVFVILIGSLFCQMFSIYEWLNLNENYHFFRIDLATFTGGALLFFGTMFRIIAIQQLGKYFTATVQLQNGQSIINTGVYSRIRHPSYLGAYLAILGSALFLHAYFSLFTSGLIMLLAYQYRIKQEEKALLQEFGDVYVSYQGQTKKFIPYLY